ncbi:hypothetical protein D3C87_1661530 [compost metagenome]
MNAGTEFARQSEIAEGELGCMDAHAVGLVEGAHRLVVANEVAMDFVAAEDAGAVAEDVVEDAGFRLQ